MAIAQLHELGTPREAKEDVSCLLSLITIAGNIIHMPIDIAQYSCFDELEDDVVDYLPTVTALDTFGCEVDLVDPDTQQPLRGPVQDVLKAQTSFHLVVRPCMWVTANGTSRAKTVKDGRRPCWSPPMTREPSRITHFILSQFYGTSLWQNDLTPLVLQYGRVVTNSRLSSFLRQ